MSQIADTNLRKKTISEEVIRRDKDTDNIIQMLLESSNSHETFMVSIVGIGGMGKTTLAEYVSMMTM